MALLLGACGGGTSGSPAAAGAATFIYVANASGNTVSVHRLDEQDAGHPLSAVIGAVPAGTGPLAMARDPSGAFLHVAGFVSCDIHSYAVVASDGSLRRTQPPLPIAGGANPAAIGVHPGGRLALVVTQQNNPAPGQVRSLRVEPLTGTLEDLHLSAFAGIAPNAIVIAPSGNFAYVVDPPSQALRTIVIDTSTGALDNPDPGRPAATGSNPVAIAMNATGRFAYVVNQGSNDVSAFRIGPATGIVVPSLGAPTRAGLEPVAIAVHPSDRFAYVANASSNDISVFRIHQDTGQLSLVATTPSSGSRPRAIAFDPSGRFAFVANLASSDISVFNVDITDGTLTAVGLPVPTGAQPAALAVTRPVR
jgi:6-phosphogluconolactonase (cycloisomerase 2 family)